MALLNYETRVATFGAESDEPSWAEDAELRFELRNTLDAYEVEELDSFGLVSLLPTISAEWNAIGRR